MTFASLTNGRAIELQAVPAFAPEELGNAVANAVAEGQRVAAFFGARTGQRDLVTLYVILADDLQNRLPAIGQNQLLSSPFNFPEVLESFRFELRLGDLLHDHGHLT